MLVIFRILQGAFGAPLLPLGQGILLASFPRHMHPLVLMLWGIGGAMVLVAPLCRLPLRVVGALGLLGTVLGLIKAFMTVASREEALGRTELLASGIYQALVTTATGLCIAIPALVLYHLFADKIERLVIEMDDITLDLVERMSSPGDMVGEH